MKNIKTISRTLNITQLSMPEKLLVIVDEFHLDMLDEMMSHARWGIQVNYILTDSEVVREMYPYHSRIYPYSVNIRSILKNDIVDRIVCCTTSLPANFIQELAAICKESGVSLLIEQDMKNARLPVTGVREIADYYFLALETNPSKLFGYTVKSVAERLFAFVALFILSPFLLLISFLIRVTTPGPVIYKQLRVGLRGRKFMIYKFRTMIDGAEKLRESLKDKNEADGPAFKIKDDPRITRIGKFLRKTGIDEIPQLFNVIQGQMSLIGPRPLQPFVVSGIKEWHLKRMSVKPGITCTWQILRDRNKVPFEEWMKLDRSYVENWSLGHDIRIFFNTVVSIFAARGA